MAGPAVLRVAQKHAAAGEVFATGEDVASKAEAGSYAARHALDVAAKHLAVGMLNASRFCECSFFFFFLPLFVRLSFVLCLAHGWFGAIPPLPPPKKNACLASINKHTCLFP